MKKVTRGTLTCSPPSSLLPVSILSGFSNPDFQHMHWYVYGSPATAAFKCVALAVAKKAKVGNWAYGCKNEQLPPLARPGHKSRKSSQPNDKDPP